jgi:hypothetical protein
MKSRRTIMDQAERQEICNRIAEALGAPTEIRMDDGRHVQSWEQADQDRGQADPKWELAVVTVIEVLVSLLFLYLAFVDLRPLLCP